MSIISDRGIVRSPAPAQAPAATIEELISALVPGSTPGDYVATAGGGIWRKLLHIGAGAEQVDLSGGGDGQYPNLEDVDGRLYTIEGESPSLLDVCAVTANGIEFENTGAVAGAIRIGLDGLPGWADNGRVFVACRVSNLTLGNTNDRMHLQICDQDTGTWAWLVAIPIKRVSTNDYRFDIYRFNGGFTFDATGLIAASSAGDHWLVFDVTPRRCTVRGDMGVAADVPDLPEDMTFHSEVGDLNGITSTGGVNSDQYNTIRLQLQTTAGAFSRATVSDLIVMKEGA